MGKDFYHEFPLAKETYDEASEVLGYDLRELIDGDEVKLNETQYTQPAILTTSVAILRVLEDAGLSPDMVAGLSLGEYTALVSAGVLDFKEAVALVAKRGALMAQAAPTGSGKMVAVLNVDPEIIEKLCLQAASETGEIVSPANYNTPTQIVIGGQAKAVERAVELLKGAGSKKLIELNVSGPFHTAILKPASDKLKEVLQEVELKEASLPVVGNTEAAVMPKEEIKSLLARQIMEPVKFYESIATLKKLGAERFIEVGPGKVLSGFVKKIDREVNLANVCDVATYEAVIRPD